MQPQPAAGFTFGQPQPAARFRSDQRQPAPALSGTNSTSSQSTLVFDCAAFSQLSVTTAPALSLGQATAAPGLSEVSFGNFNSGASEHLGVTQPWSPVHKPDKHPRASADIGDNVRKDKEVLLLTNTAKERAYLPSNVESQTALGNAFSATVNTGSCDIDPLVEQPQLSLPALMKMKEANQVIIPVTYCHRLHRHSKCMHRLSFAIFTVSFAIFTAYPSC